MKDNLELNLVTGEFQKKEEPSGVYNNLTGMYDKEDDVELRKSQGVRWPSLVGEEESVEKSEFECFAPFVKADEDQHIVYGIVYEPDEEDSQGDQASAYEIEKAAHQFMEDVQTFKVMHKGSAAKVKVLESYVAPQALTIAGTKIKKGTWILVAKVNDKKIWKAIKDGTLTGFSMAGHAATAAA